MNRLCVDIRTLITQHNVFILARDSKSKLDCVSLFPSKYYKYISTVSSVLVAFLYFCLSLIFWTLWIIKTVSRVLGLHIMWANHNQDISSGHDILLEKGY